MLFELEKPRGFGYWPQPLKCSETCKAGWRRRHSGSNAKVADQQLLTPAAIGGEPRAVVFARRFLGADARRTPIGEVLHELLQPSTIEYGDSRHDIASGPWPAGRVVGLRVSGSAASARPATVPLSSRST